MSSLAITTKGQQARGKGADEERILSDIRGSSFPTPYLCTIPEIVRHADG